MTCFVETVAETFSADEPAGAHECLVVPFRAVLRASPSKIFLPVFAILYWEIVNGGGVLHDATFTFIVFSFLSSTIVNFVRFLL